MDYSDFRWINESEAEFNDDEIMIYAPKGSEYFNNPISVEGVLPEPITTAPIFYKEVTGDFVLRVQVELEFKYDFDAACVMVVKDDTCWAKAAFERSDFGKNTMVSAITNQVTDDANGVNIDGNSVWMQVSRVDNCFAIHYSEDGVNYFMMRLFHLPVGETVKVGLEAQSPSGEGGKRYYRHLSIKNRTLNNLRAGE